MCVYACTPGGVRDKGPRISWAGHLCVTEGWIGAVLELGCLSWPWAVGFPRIRIRFAQLQTPQPVSASARPMFPHTPCGHDGESLCLGTARASERWTFVETIAWDQDSSRTHVVVAVPGVWLHEVGSA